MKTYRMIIETETVENGKKVTQKQTHSNLSKDDVDRYRTAARQTTLPGWKRKIKVVNE